MAVLGGGDESSFWLRSASALFSVDERRRDDKDADWYEDGTMTITSRAELVTELKGDFVGGR